MQFRVKGIIKLLSEINTKEANGPDTLHCWVLNEVAQALALLIGLSFYHSMW